MKYRNKEESLALKAKIEGILIDRFGGLVIPGVSGNIIMEVNLSYHGAWHSRDRESVDIKAFIPGQYRYIRKWVAIKDDTVDTSRVASAIEKMRCTLDAALDTSREYVRIKARNLAEMKARYSGATVNDSGYGYYRVTFPNDNSVTISVEGHIGGISISESWRQVNGERLLTLLQEVPL